MDLHEQSDNYCERTDFAFWSEPVNAVTNAAFVIAAAWMWQRCQGVVMGRVLCVILFAIGVGSFLFHTYATGWAALADVVPIGVFILVYLFVATRDLLGLPWWAGLLVVVLFGPYAFVMVRIFDALPFFHISNFYWSVPVLIYGYAALLKGRHPQTARGLFIGASLLCLSITIRSLDGEVCANLPLGIHFMWHILNAIMLAWMIEVYCRHIHTTTPEN